MRILTLAMMLSALAACCCTARGADSGWTSIATHGCTIEARAYIDRGRVLYDVDMPSPVVDGHPCDFTPAWQPDWSPEPFATGIRRKVAPVTDISAKTLAIPIALHEYETYDELLRFPGFDIAPDPKVSVNINRQLYNSNSHLFEINGPLFDGSVKQRRVVDPRVLAKAPNVTQTTPSGISVTVVPDGKPLGCYDGPGDQLYIRLSVRPNTRESILPNSPLYQAYKLPVTIGIIERSPGGIRYSQENDLCSGTALQAMTPLRRQGSACLLSNR